MVSVATPTGSPGTTGQKPTRRVPGPLVILGALFLAIAITSSILSAAGVSFTAAGGKSTPILGFFSGQGLLNLLTGAITNFVDFPALGVTLTMVLGLGVAQGTGALETAVRIAFARVPARIVPYGVAFLCCQGHVLSDGSFVLLPPLAMQIFKAKGRNPLAGLVAGLACVAVGYGGGLVFGTSDVGYTAVTESAAKLAHVPGYVSDTGVTMNWFITSTIGIVLPLVLGWVTVHILEPRIAPIAAAGSGTPDRGVVVTRAQYRAVALGLAAVAAYIAVVIAWWLWPGSALRGDGGALVQSPFLKNLVPILALAFVIFGMIYGRVAGIPKEQRKLLPLLTNSIREMSGFIVIVFVLAQVISVLTWSNLSSFFAVGIASGLDHIGITGYLALLAVAILTAVMSVFISGTALWGLEAPVMVPALMLNGLAPAGLQIAFRMAVQWGSVVSPANVFIYFTYNEARKIDSSITIGWLIRRTSFFVPAAAVTWFAVLAVFYFAGIPVGPGVGLKLG
ncbi:AbgT family transporter [Streptomyces sp. TS71-3]|uniref:AbgT family transporter n=1 Tax=Streptomyces sp. TS71-3 TaxID=2733862 RepID=UPI001B0EA16E|nr:AbgT family transporter [Streptomyces sp. TS71-3]GHJ39782.1 p-aminobenzoyl-glutamate transporter [Streptomyces sp. TS71-3]